MRMLVALGLALAIVGVVAAGCGGSSAGASSGKIKPTLINAQVATDSVSVSVNDVNNAVMAHFKVKIGSRDEVFMAYTLGGTIQVRASVCPPCGSQSFSLVGETLVCNSCGTVFNAKTGTGISGACVDYPKAQVTYQNLNGKIVTKVPDLSAAFQNTLKPGWP